MGGDAPERRANLHSVRRHHRSNRRLSTDSTDSWWLVSFVSILKSTQTPSFPILLFFFHRAI
jgi:hypothetical protein